MKKMLFVLTTVMFAACGSSDKSGGESNTPKTFEEKVTEVCDCFDEAKNDMSQRMECMKLQSDLSKTFEKEERQKFILETNSCSGM